MNKFPENWHLFKLKDLSVIGDGAHASIKRIEMGILYLTSKNFGKDRLDLSKVDYISEDDYIKYFKKKSKALTRPESGDVLLGIIGTIGSPYLVKSTDEFGLSSSVSIIRADIAKIDPKYLYYWFKTPLFQNALNQIKSGVAQSFLSLAMIGSLPCAYPQSLQAQQKIARILSAYDDLIENNLKRIKLLEEMAQLTYEEWFVRMKFPRYKQALIDLETGLPEGWKEITFDKSCNVSGGGTPSKEVNEYWDNGDITWFSPTDLSKASNLVLLDSRHKITKKGLQKSSAKLMKPNSFMMTSRATIGLFGVINKPFSTNQGFINITPHENNHKYFLLFNFKSRVKEFYNHASGATFPEISKSKFKRLKINWPPSRILQKWHLKVSPIVDSIENLTVQNQHLKEARNILLPRLMTSMIDVESLELPETVANKTLPKTSENNREVSIYEQ